MAHDEPTADPLARAPELQALLRDLDGLRLSIATDLSLVAAAVDAGSPEIAAAVVDSDRAQLQAFEQRALLHLGLQDVAADELESPAVVDLQAARVRRRRSVLAAATPLVASAAAVLGVLAGFVPTGSDDTPDRAAGTQTAMASYQQLTRLTLQGAEAAEVARVAERLHDQLATIVAQAAEDPAAAQQALALLESEALVLDSSADRDALSDVIAEARTLVARLRAALPAVPVRAPRVPGPGPAPDDVVLPAPVVPATVPTPPSPRPEPSPQDEQREKEAQPSSSPSPSSTQSPEQGQPDDGNDPVLPDAVLPPD